MENYTKELKKRIFDLNEIAPGDVIQYYRYTETLATSTENALVTKVSEDKIVAIRYENNQESNFKCIIFRPNETGIEIRNVIKRGTI